MIYKPILQLNRKRHVALLYAVVFRSAFSVWLIIWLFLSFAIQPIHQAYANEVLQEEDVVEIDNVAMESDEEDVVEIDNVAMDSNEELIQELDDESVDLDPVADESVADDESTVVDNVSESEQIVDGDNEESKSESDGDNGVEGIDVERVLVDDGQINSQPSASSTEVQEETDSDEEELIVSDASSTSTESNNILDATSTSTETIGENYVSASSTSEGDLQETNDAYTETATTSSDVLNSDSDNDMGASSGDHQSQESDEEFTDQENQEAGDDETVDIVDSSGAESQEESDTNNRSHSSSVDTSSEDDNLIDNEAVEASVNGLIDDVVNEVVTLSRQLVTEENFYQFSRQSCVAVGDGTYHCTTKDNVAIDPDSDVYAEKDSDGDTEIFMRTSNGDIKQLSDNNYDDSSPDLDLASMRVVWQRMIDGRYQIISYDLDEREETQLTSSRTNSMEPKVSKDGIVWQAWDGNDWEIIYFDGQYTDQITDNEIQDVTPVVEDGYIVWSMLGGKETEARVYSLDSGEIMTISGHEGGAVANPRFVLVYDTKFDNGDVITQGFDPVTGLANPITAKPTELPFDIPEPDPVGEIRALIQNKSTQNNKDIVSVPDVDSDNNGELNLASTSTTSLDVLDLHEQIDPDLDDSTIVTGDEYEFVINDDDLVITREASSTTSVINDRYHEDTPTTSATSTQS